MAVLEQLTDVSDKFFDAAVTTNDKVHDVAKNFVTKIQDADVKVPLADRFADAELPLADKIADIDLPEPLEAVDAYFNFVGKGIEANRSLATKMINLIGEATDTTDDVIDTTAKEAPAKKTAPKKD